MKDIGVKIPNEKDPDTVQLSINQIEIENLTSVDFMYTKERLLYFRFL